MKKEIFNKRTGGYTLVEMVVVMGIFATLSALSAGAWIGIRNQSKVDDATQLFITEVRNAQNKAFAVEKSPGEDTQVWAIAPVHNTSNIYSARYYIATPTSTSLTRSGIGGAYPGSVISVSPVIITASNASTNYIGFTNPFGRGYVSNAPSGSASFWCSVANARLNPSGEFGVNRGGVYYSNWLTSAVTFTFQLGNYSRNVIVEPNGDVYAQ